VFAFNFYFNDQKVINHKLFYLIEQLFVAKFINQSGLTEIIFKKGLREFPKIHNKKYKTELFTNLNLCYHSTKRSYREQKNMFRAALNALSL